MMADDEKTVDHDSQVMEWGSATSSCDPRAETTHSDARNEEQTASHNARQSDRSTPDTKSAKENSAPTCLPMRCVPAHCKEEQRRDHEQAKTYGLVPLELVVSS